MQQKVAAAVELSTEAEALADIAAWSNEWPPWQRDALRRLCLHEFLTSDDIADLLIICKDSDAPSEPLTGEHIRDASAVSGTVALKSLHSVKHVNALAGGEMLTFDKSGVTVLYGDNGAGKSGYARILKRACRARLSRTDTILPNIYEASGGSPSACIEFTINDQKKVAAWTLHESGDPSLSAVSVFDSRTANVHVDQANDVAYTPLPLRVLAGLAQCSQDIRQRLNAEIKALEQKTPAVISKPDCQPGTRVGKLIEAVGAATPQQVDELAFLTEAQQSRLTTLKGDLAADPARTGKQLQALRTRLDAAIARMDRLMTAVSDANIATLAAASRALATARIAAEAASASLFANEPLPDIGADVWRTLWEAARAYSDKSAYPAQVFPFIDAGARCVLCLQELDAGATGRLSRFEAFVKDESKRRQQQESDAHAALLASLDQAAIGEGEVSTLAGLIEHDLAEASLATETVSGIAAALKRLQHIRGHHGQTDMKAPALTALPLDRLRERSADLLTRSTALLADGGSEERKKLTAERDELADREWLSRIKSDVLAEIGRKREISALQKAAKDTATNRVTSKSAEMAERLVTNALRAQFAKEVDKLGVGGLAIELRQHKTTQGVPSFRVSLIKKPDAPVGEVLSEGEHRCIALAAFLAEMATTESQSALVFDDPVSSLDHMHRESVAKRLAEEGKRRQVIVFTHDLAFLFLLNESCREKETHIGFRSISKGTEFSGFCQANPPPNAQPVEKVIDGMRTHLAGCRIHFERGNQNEWYTTVRSFQEQLRSTWERAVEEVLSPVIKRLANKVDTKGLFKITVLTTEDCRVMRDAFGRCSALLHSEAELLNTPLPNPKVIEDEIAALGSWVKDLRDRQAKLQMTETVVQKTACDK